MGFLFGGLITSTSQADPDKAEGGFKMKRFTAWMLVVALILLYSGISMAAGSNTLTVSANVVPACKFSSGTSILGFGALDPSVGGNANGQVITQFWCTKGTTTDSIAADNGANFAGGSKNIKDLVSLDLIPYTLTLTKDGNLNNGPGSPRSLTIDGSVLGADYINKSAGS